MRETIPEGFERGVHQVFCKTCRRPAKRVEMCLSITYHCPHCEQNPVDTTPEQREQDEDTQPIAWRVVRYW